MLADPPPQGLERLEVTIDGLWKRRFFHRGTNADKGAITQVFHNQDYALHRLARGEELAGRFHGLVAGDETPLIIDAGANIGTSAVWFSATFHKAHIVAIEPDAANAALLRSNTQGLDVTVVEAALGASDGRVNLEDPGFGEWGYRTTEAATGAIPRVSMSRLCREEIAKGRTPFIAKIDIEGAESELFAEDTGWVASFPLIIIELHDWLIPGKATSRNVLRALSAHDRDFVHIGENVFSIANGP